MAIEIIHRGQTPEDRSYEAECWYCNSKVKWLKKDANRVFEGDARDGPFTQIDCPVCGTLMTGY